MSAFSIRSTGNISTNTVGVVETQTLDFGDMSTADTVKLTYNTHETGAITFSADMTTDIVAALVALTDFDSGDVACTKTSTDVYVVTFAGNFAGKNAGAITITSPSGCTPVGVTETLSGRSEKSVKVSLGSRFAILYGVRWGLFVDGATNELVITDAAGRVVYSVTGKDTNVSGAKLATFIGQDGKDEAGNATANVGPTLVEGPLTVRVRNGQGTVSPASGSVELYVKNGISSQIVERSTGVIATNSSGDKTVTMSLGATLARIFHMKLGDGGFDSSTDYSVKDANGASVFVKTALDATTALDFALGFDGEDQAGNAAADALEGVFRSPLTVVIANGGNVKVGSVTIWAEV